MRTIALPVRLAMLLVGAAAAGVYALGVTTRSPARASAVSAELSVRALLDPAFKSPLLVAASGHTGGLEAWRINPKGSIKPRQLTAPLRLGYASLVANGEMVFAAMEHPAQILAYDLKTNTQATISDPFGMPVDIAIGKDASLYVVNVAKPYGNVAWYPKGLGQAQELQCKYVDLGEYIAVDNEGDIFVQGYGTGHFTGVVEFPNGPSGPQSGHCMRVHLVSENGIYVGGVTIDPETDDLVTLDNPGLCAGSYEGRMTIYPKPYRAKTSTSVILGAMCANGIRLNADSTLVFYRDAYESGDFTYIASSTYPAGQSLGRYSEGGSFGGPQGPSGFTTIPNSLPN